MALFASTLLMLTCTVLILGVAYKVFKTDTKSDDK